MKVNGTTKYCLWFQSRYVINNKFARLLLVVSLCKGVSTDFDHYYDDTLAHVSNCEAASNSHTWKNSLTQAMAK